MLISSLRYTGSYNWIRKNGKGRSGQAIRASTCSTDLGVFFSSYLECSHFVSRRATWNPNYFSIQAIRASTCSTYLGVFFSSYLKCSHFLSRRATWNPNYSSIAHCCSEVCELIDLLYAFLSKPAHNKKLEPVNLKVFLCFRGRKIKGSIEIKPESWRNLIEKELPELLTLIMEKIPLSLWMALFGQNSLGGWIFTVVGRSDFSVTTWQPCLLQLCNNWSWDLKTFCHLSPANLTWH